MRRRNQFLKLANQLFVLTPRERARSEHLKYNVLTPREQARSEQLKYLLLNEVYPFTRFDL